MRQKIQGTVTLEVIVGADGRVEKSRVVQSLDDVYGLDEAAMEAVAAWPFRPGTFNGQPARFDVQVDLSFRLR